MMIHPTTAAPRRRSAWRASRAFGLTVLLPLLMLFAQQGELRHETGHLAAASRSSNDKAPAGHDHCALCLAFAHLASAARTETSLPTLLTNLAFRRVAEPLLEIAAPGAIAPRSRGPPVS